MLVTDFEYSLFSFQHPQMHLSFSKAYFDDSNLWKSMNVLVLFHQWVSSDNTRINMNSWKSASKYQQMMMYPSTECFLSGIMVKVDHKWKRISLDKLDQCVFVYFLEIISGKFSITKNYSFMFIFLKHDDLSVFNLKQNNI